VVVSYDDLKLRDADGEHTFRDYSVEALNMLVAYYGAKIVISSSWRRKHTFRNIEAFQKLFADRGIEAEVVGLTLVRFEEKNLINAFGSVIGIVASLDTFKLMCREETDPYRYNTVDEGIINVFKTELNQALNTITTCTINTGNCTRACWDMKGVKTFLKIAWPYSILKTKWIC
jgi:hypothetical protein